MHLDTVPEPSQHVSVVEFYLDGVEGVGREVLGRSISVDGRGCLAALP
jgi:hypothetical protein